MREPLDVERLDLRPEPVIVGVGLLDGIEEILGVHARQRAVDDAPGSHHRGQGLHFLRATARVEGGFEGEVESGLGIVAPAGPLQPVEHLVGCIAARGGRGGKRGADDRALEPHRRHGALDVAQPGDLPQRQRLLSCHGSSFRCKQLTGVAAFDI